MPVLTEAQTRALRRALGALNNILPSLELLKALGEVSEYWQQTAATLYARYQLLCRLAETALSFEAGMDRPVVSPAPPGIAGVPTGLPATSPQYAVFAGGTWQFLDRPPAGYVASGSFTRDPQGRNVPVWVSAAEAAAEAANIAGQGITAASLRGMGPTLSPGMGPGIPPPGGF
jgi:hypothetical protein